MTTEQSKLNGDEKVISEPPEWSKKKLDEVASINLGQSPKGEYYNKDGNGPHFIQGSKNFGNKYPKLDRFCSKPKRQADEGDVLISVRAPVGPVNIAPEKICIGRGVTALKMYEGPNDYLYYFLKYFEDMWSQYADGTTFNSITKSDLQNLEIPYPPLKERNNIAYILNRIDDKIEVNNQINDIIEEMAQILFRSWFVEFEPYANFKDSEIGKVPDSFEVNLLEDVLSFQRGYSYSGDELIDEESDKDVLEGYPMVNLGNISPGGGYRPEKIKYCEGVPKDRYLVEPGDLVISHTDMTQDQDILGSPVIVPNLDQEPLLFSHHLYAIREVDLPKEYLYYYFLSRYFKPKAESFASGTTVLSFSSKIGLDVYIPIPPEEDLKRFVDVARPIFEVKENIRQENDNLTDLRNTLLPQLLTGEVRVNDISLDGLEVDSGV
ncbi:restriction endonuclease subunit S [Halodesulfurarchaeum sp. HSR-GB]|uniref:restriction endonuclease subunit S n=1 Tax=Halodesulfurarchaeum sp. HSR-GB TaxID=3074077 RepID=UPI00286321F3|nr:restriction endonuclease subunit S [Halodesulfurarchaeum sp. HSR-GB]MDR5657744.1 restriction endonuclease subunit S [Halodesulfurarchaeum sp. HSR-GB]